MPLQLRHARPEDLPRIFDIRVAAFKNDIFTRLVFPQGRTQATIDKGMRLWRDELTDTAAPLQVAVDDQSSEIIAFAKWKIFEVPRNEEEWGAVLHPSNAGEEANNEAWQVFERAKHERSARLIGGRPHVYLSYLCTDPKKQGLGAGSALLRWGTELADEKQLPCFLVSTNAGHNLYLRRGFEDLDRYEQDVTSFGIPEIASFDFMCKQPVKHT